MVTVRGARRLVSLVVAGPLIAGLVVVESTFRAFGAAQGAPIIDPPPSVCPSRDAGPRRSYDADYSARLLAAIEAEIGELWPEWEWTARSGPPEVVLADVLARHSEEGRNALSDAFHAVAVLTGTSKTNPRARASVVASVAADADAADLLVDPEIIFSPLSDALYEEARAQRSKEGIPPWTLMSDDIKAIALRDLRTIASRAPRLRAFEVHGLDALHAQDRSSTGQSFIAGRVVVQIVQARAFDGSDDHDRLSAIVSRLLRITSQVESDP